MLKEIEKHQNLLIKLLENKDNRASLYKWLRSELAYTSNAIEGNTLTRKETELVIEENLTSSSKPLMYYQEAVNHSKAFEYILELVNKNVRIGEKELLHLHKLILSGINTEEAGFYRNCMVRISGSRVILPNPIKVPALMENFCSWLKEQDITNPITAILSHLKFVSIHPFVDGNGRCARLLMNALLLQAGLVPIIIQPRDRKKYLSVIEQAQLTQKANDYINYMQSLLLRSMKIIISMLDTDKADVKPNELLTISQFAKLVGVPKSTIRYWVKNDKFAPHSYTDSGYMLFVRGQVEEAGKLKKY
mgnify:CR=1 FL=1